MLNVWAEWIACYNNKRLTEPVLCRCTLRDVWKTCNCLIHIVSNCWPQNVCFCLGMEFCIRVILWDSPPYDRSSVRRKCLLLACPKSFVSSKQTWAFEKLPFRHSLILPRKKYMLEIRYLSKISFMYFCNILLFCSSKLFTLTIFCNYFIKKTTARIIKISPLPKLF